MNFEILGKNIVKEIATGGALFPENIYCIIKDIFSGEYTFKPFSEVTVKELNEGLIHDTITILLID